MAVYLMGITQVKPYRMDDLIEVYQHWKPIAEELGWKLVFAGKTHIGRIFEVTTIWEIPSFDDYERFHQATAAREDWTKWAPLFGEAMESETTKAVLKLPFSP